MTLSTRRHSSFLMMMLLCLTCITSSSSRSLAFVPTSLAPPVLSPTSFFRQLFLPPSISPPPTPASHRISPLSVVSTNNINNANAGITKDDNDNDDNIFMTTDTVLTTKSSILDKNLTSDEISVVNVVRRYGPSVAYVTSYSIIGDVNSDEIKSQKENNNNDNKGTIPPPRSTPLGSGSAFAISSSDGYFVTNYHVIERAYQMQQSQIQMDSFLKNITQSLFPKSSKSRDEKEDKDAGNKRKGTIDNRARNRSRSRGRARRTAQVYLRLASSSTSSTDKTSSSLVPARIVSVKPELDTAILHINMTESLSSSITLPQPIPYGSSSMLLVGQNVLAIGNPFGLDQSITSGVVSALGRSVKGIAGNNINKCIQTDAAINPGNSGGPLLNSNGECIGMNTMIITTSGSNAGIGFAISMDDVRDYVEKEIDDDRNAQLALMYESGKRKRRGWLGVEIVTDTLLQSQLEKRVKKIQFEDGENDSDVDSGVDGVFVVKVDRNSPAYNAQIKPLLIDKRSSRISYAGDRIVAVNSNIVKSSKELYDDLRTRVVGENISITVEDALGVRRVVYVELKEKKD